MNWLEVDIYTTTEGIDAVCGRLLGIGITGFAIKDAKDFEEFLENKTGNWDYIDDDLMNLKDCETTVTCYIPTANYTVDGEDDCENIAQSSADMLAGLKAELIALKELDKEHVMGRLEYSLVNVAEEDWANNWKQYFKPLTVGDKLLIKPSWEACDNIGSRKVLEIDPASSFGTGQHDTTQLCLELLEKHLCGGEKLLDLGCGSGILSIAGLLLGASSAYAVDIDTGSVATAKENAIKNGIEESLYITKGGNIINDEELRKDIGKGYKIVLANIVADVIIAMSPYFKDFLTDDGILIISGIIDERSEEVIAKMESEGYTRVDYKESHGWVAMAYRSKV